MDNNNYLPSNNQSATSPVEDVINNTHSQVQPEAKLSNKNGSNRIKFGLAIILTAAISFSLAYLLFAQNPGSNIAIEPEPDLVLDQSQSQEQQTENQPEFTTNTSLPDDWNYMASQVCGVNVPFPPHTLDDYFTPEEFDKLTPVSEKGAEWIFTDGDNSGLFSFENLTTIRFSHKESGSGYIPASVEISCSENTQNLDSDGLLAQIKQDLNALNAEQPEMIITVTEKGVVNKWGQPVQVVSFEGGMFNPEQNFYLLTTPKYIYMITQDYLSQNELLIQDTNTIFDNLVF